MGELLEVGHAVRRSQPALHKAAKALMKKLLYEESGQQMTPKRILNKSIQTTALEQSVVYPAAREVYPPTKLMFEEIKGLILDTRATLVVQQHQIEELKRSQVQALDHQQPKELTWTWITTAL